MWRVVWKYLFDIGETISETLTRGAPLARSLSAAGSGGNTIPRGTVTNANGSSDCSSVRPEALVPGRPGHVMSVFGRTLPSREIIESIALRGERRRGKRNDK